MHYVHSKQNKIVKNSDFPKMIIKIVKNRKKSFGRYGTNYYA